MSLLRVTLLAFMLAMAAAPMNASAQALTPMRVGIAAPTVNMLPMWVGEASGLFAARGLSVEIVDTGGGSRGLAMLRAGELSAMNVGLSAVIDENTKGADLRLIAASANTMSFGFFGARGVTSANALRGRKVAVSTLRSESDAAAMLALKQLGLARGDVELVETGTTLARMEALLSGEIAATALNEPVNIMAQRRGLPLLVDLAEDTPWILNGIVVTRAATAGERATLLNFLRAYAEAVHFALANPERAQEILRARFAGLDAEIARATYEDFRRRIPRDAAPSAAAAANMLQELPALGTEVRSRDVAAYVDASLIAELRREDLFTQLQGKYRTN
jgi:NitT/TauT family transport system substrate-binding protein